MRTLMVRNNQAPRTYRGFNDFDRLFEDVFGSIMQNPTFDLTDRQPQVDIRTTENGYEIAADLPGFDEKDIDVSLENDLLTISADRTSENETEKGGNGYLVRERTQARYRRTFALPEDVNREKVDARYKNGVLTLKLERKPESKPKQIKIKSE